MQKLEKATLFRPVGRLGEMAERLLESLNIPYFRIFSDEREVLLLTSIGEYKGISGIESYIRAYMPR